MIEFHNHLIPGVDDGAQNIEESIALAKALVEEGVTHTVVTPHHLNRKYTNYAEDIRRQTEELQEALDGANVPLQVFPGQEVRIHETLIDSIDRGEIQFLDENGQYMLLEFPTTSIPTYTEDLLYELKHRGIIPIIAHPERNHIIQEEPNRLYRMIGMGALSQVTAASVAGIFGKDIQEQSLDFLDKNLAHFMGSDMHDLGYRRAYIQDAHKVIAKELGNDFIDVLQLHTKHVINGERFKAKRPEQVEEKKRGFFGFFRK